MSATEAQLPSGASGDNSSAFEICRRREELAIHFEHLARVHGGGGDEPIITPLSQHLRRRAMGTLFITANSSDLKEDAGSSALS